MRIFLLQYEQKDVKNDVKVKCNASKVYVFVFFRASGADRINSTRKKTNKITECFDYLTKKAFLFDVVACVALPQTFFIRLVSSCITLLCLFLFLLYFLLCNDHPPPPKMNPPVTSPMTSFQKRSMYKRLVISFICASFDFS